MFSFSRPQLGFTFIELMTSTAIIGVLASVAIPAYMDYLLRSKAIEALTISQEAMRKITEYYAFYGTFPQDNAEAGLRESDHFYGHYVKNITVENGAIHLELIDSKFKMNSEEEGNAMLTLRPTLTQEGTAFTGLILSWTCGYLNPLPHETVYGVNKTNANPNFLPLECRE
ncbi:pilin [Thioflexithrix psekupsensis]|uniref:Prepilin-type N-terminal cleavage/methylation domain-containing protein n=1 Tax=Thioflexithrix psekupsensis TaxID=1570016 RepID=A0A251X8H7_9GAMM|nr:pilin [Thioflexithrix psekupsensis]OUD14235.1 hypothetical protein TPSD3_07860 [Thioflexithrix psekupsensis]